MGSAEGEMDDRKRPEAKLRPMRAESPQQLSARYLRGLAVGSGEPSSSIAQNIPYKKFNLNFNHNLNPSSSFPSQSIRVRYLSSTRVGVVF